MKSSAMCLSSSTTNIDHGFLTEQVELCPNLPGDLKEPEYADHSGHGAQVQGCCHLDGDLYLAIYYVSWKL